MRELVCAGRADPAALRIQVRSLLLCSSPAAGTSQPPAFRWKRGIGHRVAARFAALGPRGGGGARGRSKENEQLIGCGMTRPMPVGRLRPPMWRTPSAAGRAPTTQTRSCRCAPLLFVRPHHPGGVTRFNSVAAIHPLPVSCVSCLFHRPPHKPAAAGARCATKEMTCR